MREVSAKSTLMAAWKHGECRRNDTDSASGSRMSAADADSAGMREAGAELAHVGVFLKWGLGVGS